MPTTIGIIGGSGLYDMAELTDRRDVSVDTPFGPPSAPLVTGRLSGKEVVFLARHGIGHRLTPSELNFRANIYAMKTLGVERILSASAVGQPQRGIRAAAPRHSRPVLRPHARPRQHVLRRGAGRARRLRAPVLRSRCRRPPTTLPSPPAPPSHKGGTYVCMEGPQFSTKAESVLYRQWGMDIIGMTNLQEAKLAREAEICYTTIALVTDYDCWHPVARLGDGRHDHRQPDAERPHRPEGDRRGDRAPRHRAAHLPVRDRPRHRHHHPAGARARGDEGQARPHRRKVPMKIVVTGSIAFDYLMSFPGSFTEHLLPEHLSKVSLSFLVDTMDKRRGGCAPNIAYTLALLGERPYLMATAGQDFGDYRAWLDAAAVDTSLVKVVDGKFTASFFCSTDQHNNQIASFYTGAMANAAELSFRTVGRLQARDRLAERSGGDEPVRGGVPRPRHSVHLRLRPAGRARLRRRAARRAHRRRGRDLERLRVPGPLREDRPRRGRPAGAGRRRWSSRSASTAARSSGPKARLRCPRCRRPASSIRPASATRSAAG